MEVRSFKVFKKLLPFSVQEVLIQMVTDQMQKFRWTLFAVSDLKYRFVEIAQVRVQRSFYEFDDLTEFHIAAVKTPHLIQGIDHFYQADLGG